MSRIFLNQKMAQNGAAIRGLGLLFNLFLLFNFSNCADIRDTQNQCVLYQDFSLVKGEGIDQIGDTSTLRSDDTRFRVCPMDSQLKSIEILNTKTIVDRVIFRRFDLCKAYIVIVKSSAVRGSANTFIMFKDSSMFEWQFGLQLKDSSGLIEATYTERSLMGGRALALLVNKMDTVNLFDRLCSLDQFYKNAKLEDSSDNVLPARYFLSGLIPEYQ